nr:glycosyltransferase [Pontibacter sp. E15-1]
MTEEQNDKAPLVSVVIPCYNCEEFIQKAVTSALEQTYANIELILVDNNSTDGTSAILKRLEQEHSGKIHSYAEVVNGACAARNHGLYKAAGDWIQFLDADDELLPDKVEGQLQIALAAKTDVVVSDYCKVGAKQKSASPKKVVVEDDPWLGLINSALGVTSALLWRKENLLAVNGWDATLSSSQEYDLLFRLLTQGAKVSIDHRARTIIYGRPESVSRTGSADKLQQVLLNRYDLRRRIYDFLSEKEMLQPVYKKQLDAYLYYHLLLISEMNMPYFKEQVKSNEFGDIGIVDKLKVFSEFIRHSSKRKYGYSNKLLKLAEWQYFFCKNLYLLRF